MNILVVTIISILSFFSETDQSEMDKAIMHALKNGNAKELSSYFTSSIKLSIHNEDQIASRHQAEFIVLDYFKNNKLIDIKKAVQQKDSQINFLIYEVKTDKRQVRVFMKIVTLGNKDRISEFRVE